jgi:DNA end-binding protein Ku
MRSIWKGSVAFGLVNVPVKVYSATEDHDLKFHQVHARDNGRIKYQRVCEECGEAVEYRDIAKAYESDTGQTVVITDEDIATLPEERSHEIEVLEFVPAGDIDPLMYGRSYFLEPDGKSAKSYVLLAKALSETDRVAIVHFALRNKTRLAALRVKDFGRRQVMVVHTLLWPDEIRDPDFPNLDADVEVRAPELKMAGQVVESMADDFHPEQYTDTYQQQLTELVESKLAGGQAFTPICWPNSRPAFGAAARRPRPRNRPNRNRTPPRRRPRRRRRPPRPSRRSRPGRPRRKSRTCYNSLVTVGRTREST